MIDKLKLKPIEIFTPETNVNWCHKDLTNHCPLPTPLEVVQHLIEVETTAGTSVAILSNTLKNVRITFDIDDKRTADQTSYSIHEHITHALPDSILTN